LLRFPCMGNLTGTSEHHQARCKSKNNNVYCRVFKLCLNFSFGNLYLSAYGYWRGQGFYPPKNYGIHSLAGNTVEEAVEVQRPRVEDLKNAISQIRRKESGDNLSFSLKDEKEAEKIVK
ncbi:hypothetical protein PMAYCL1PPCAC_13218, partial [Pristionchus mayeri]